MGWLAVFKRLVDDALIPEELDDEPDVGVGSYQYQEISGAVAAEGLMGFWGVVADAC